MRVSVARRVAQVVSRATGDAASSFVLALDHLSRRGLVEQSSRQVLYSKSTIRYNDHLPVLFGLLVGSKRNYLLVRGFDRMFASASLLATHCVCVAWRRRSFPGQGQRMLGLTPQRTVSTQATS